MCIRNARARFFAPAFWALAASWGSAAMMPFVAGCDLKSATESTATLAYTENARAAYQEALASFLAKEWDDARSLMTEVKRRFPYSRYARLAELRLSDIDFEQEKYSEAVTSYRDFIMTHRTDSEVEYARFRMAKALFLDVEDTIILPPLEERDQANLLETFKELKGYMSQFGRGRYRAETAYMLQLTMSRLVRHELYVARYYIRDDRFDAAVARVDYAVKQYPGSGLEAEALVLKGETLLKMHEPDKAKETFRTVINDYGGPFAVTAKDFLAFLEPLPKPQSKPLSR